jgi:hypothetical protein
VYAAPGISRDCVGWRWPGPRAIRRSRQGARSRRRMRRAAPERPAQAGQVCPACAGPVPGGRAPPGPRYGPRPAPRGDADTQPGADPRTNGPGTPQAATSPVACPQPSTPLSCPYARRNATHGREPASGHRFAVAVAPGRNSARVLTAGRGRRPSPPVPPLSARSARRHRPACVAERPLPILFSGSSSAPGSWTHAAAVHRCLIDADVAS